MLQNNSWESKKVVQLNGTGGQILLDAKFQIMTESWNRVAAASTLIYMPERHRLLMSVNIDYGPQFKPVHYAMVTISDDGGETWSGPKPIRTDEQGNPDPALNCIFSATYLGEGKVLVSSEGFLLFSSDYGDTWDRCVQTPEGFNAYFSMFADRDPDTGKLRRLINPSYSDTGVPYSHGGLSISALWFSYDEGITWDKFIKVPEWYGFNENYIVRAANGDLVAALRSDTGTDATRKHSRSAFDHSSGLGVSISTDDGYTWSKVNMLYDWGRHHASIVLMPDGDLIITYVVRMGYPVTGDGFAQWGIEAIVSKDNGRTWDMDRRYILATHQGKWKGPKSWGQAVQHAASVLLPDGSILTAFGTGCRAKIDAARTELPSGLISPRDIGLVSWTKNTNLPNEVGILTKAVYHSDLRNKVTITEGSKSWEKAANPDRINLSVSSAGATVTTSDSDDNPDSILFDPWDAYNFNCFRFETIPAWVEISWPVEQAIDEVAIHPGAPEMSWTAPDTECVPLNYRLQYESSGEWLDLIEPVVNALRYNDDPQYTAKGAYQHQEKEFKYVHKFQPVSVNKIRMYITQTSDSGIRASSDGKVVVPVNKRKTFIRRIDVFKASCEPN